MRRPSRPSTQLASTTRGWGTLEGNCPLRTAQPQRSAQHELVGGRCRLLAGGPPEPTPTTPTSAERERWGVGSRSDQPGFTESPTPHQHGAGREPGAQGFSERLELAQQAQVHRLSAFLAAHVSHPVSVRVRDRDLQLGFEDRVSTTLDTLQAVGSEQTQRFEGQGEVGHTVVGEQAVQTSGSGGWAMQSAHTTRISIG